MEKLKVVGGPRTGETVSLAFPGTTLFAVATTVPAGASVRVIGRNGERFVVEIAQLRLKR